MFDFARFFNPKGLLIALCVGLVAGAVSSGVIVHRLDTQAANARYEALELRDARLEQAAVAKAAAVQKAQDDVSLQAAVAQASAQERVVYRTQKVIQEVPHYVTAAQDARGCVTYGLVRVLDAAALGVDPASLQLPAGQSDDACSPVAPSALASSVAGNYGVAWQNAEQLNGLVAYETARQRVDGEAALVNTRLTAR